jgi:hypothetical protein
MKKGTHNAYQMSSDPDPIRPLAGFGPAQPDPASAPGGRTLRPEGTTTRSPWRAGGGGGGVIWGATQEAALTSVTVGTGLEDDIHTYSAGAA